MSQVENKVRMATTVCSKCKTTVQLDLGDLSYDEAIKMIDTLDNSNREFPGFHVEFGGWRKRWDLDNAFDLAYTEKEKFGSTIVHTIEILSENEGKKTFEGFDCSKEADRYLGSIMSKPNALQRNRIYYIEKNRVGEIIDKDTIY
ncbi:hypothetical protein [Oceanobacillus profundus]|uniref:Uncharacterized protein n=1 Tax=Oceanobacillus profundus TaxID=372463 RepID=A0A417YGK4_9BACI|nr:hypothetical protein [Oceanobacillus profundus]RHW31933.1 hypothetical protein D1B32_11890 [Oceanobacillus profundus]